MKEVGYLLVTEWRKSGDMISSFLKIFLYHYFFVNINFDRVFWQQSRESCIFPCKMLNLNNLLFQRLSETFCPFFLALWPVGPLAYFFALWYFSLARSAFIIVFNVFFSFSFILLLWYDSFIVVMRALSRCLTWITV